MTSDHDDDFPPNLWLTHSRWHPLQVQSADPRTSLQIARAPTTIVTIVNVKIQKQLSPKTKTHFHHCQCQCSFHLHCYKLRHFSFQIFTIKKTPKKNGGAPKFWCPGTRTLVPPMFLTDYMVFCEDNMCMFYLY